MQVEIFCLFQNLNLYLVDLEQKSVAGIMHHAIIESTVKIGNRQRKVMAFYAYKQ